VEHYSQALRTQPACEVLYWHVRVRMRVRVQSVHTRLLSVF
jgi:hypothetical protein